MGSLFVGIAFTLLTLLMSISIEILIIWLTLFHLNFFPSILIFDHSIVILPNFYLHFYKDINIMLFYRTSHIPRATRRSFFIGSYWIPLLHVAVIYVPSQISGVENSRNVLFSAKINNSLLQPFSFRCNLLAYLLLVVFH